MTELVELSLAEAARAIARRDVSPVELASACLDQIDRLDTRTKAFVAVDGDAVLLEAEKRRSELKSSPPRGPLHGVPVAIKDLIDVQGLPTRAGSEITSAHPVRTDAAVVRRLRDAGAVILGKTNTHEFAYGVSTPPTRNPWDVRRIPGGSSGGSAVAVATRMCPGAIGTDTAGSIRIPSSLCGVSGLKPRRGSIPMVGVIPLAPTLDSCGPIARSAEDLSLLWEGMSHHPSLIAPASLRIARPRAFSDVAEIDPEVEATVEDGVRSLLSTGSTEVIVAIPHFDRWEYPRAIPMMVEALMVHRERGFYPERADDYSDETRDYLRFAEGISAADHLSCLRTVELLRDQVVSALRDVDVLALPTTPLVAPTHEEAQARDPGGNRRPVVMRLTKLCGWVNHCDLAAVSIPCGSSKDGLPIGLQLIGETVGAVLAAAAAFQRITDFHLRTPPALDPDGGS